MPELLRLKTNKFSLSIWSNDIQLRKEAYQRTIHRRNKDKNISDIQILIYPPVDLDEIECCDQPIINDPKTISNIPLNENIFFENIQYQFEWEFYDEVDLAYLTHRLNSVNNSFRFIKRTERSNARITGNINTGNNVGWMKLPLRYKSDGREYGYDFSFEVLPSKMDLHSDLPMMYQAIDAAFPLWRFNLAEKTEQSVSNSKKRGDFSILWLANFTALRKKLEQGLKVIANSPHNRLQSKTRNIKADNIKGKLPNNIARKIKEDFENGIFHKRYKAEKKHLSVDTPENQFIKMVVLYSKNRLAMFESKLKENEKSPENQRISSAFIKELNSWQEPFKKMQNQSFLKDVSDYQGLTRESLVLQQKAGYSAVYRVWQELKI